MKFPIRPLDAVCVNCGAKAAHDPPEHAETILGHLWSPFDVDGKRYWTCFQPPCRQIIKDLLAGGAKNMTAN